MNGARKTTHPLYERYAGEQANEIPLYWNFCANAGPERAAAERKLLLYGDIDRSQTLEINLGKDQFMTLSGRGLPVEITKHIENPVEFYSRVFDIRYVDLCPVAHAFLLTSYAGGRPVTTRARISYRWGQDAGTFIHLGDSLVRLDATTPGKCLHDEPSPRE